MAKNQQLKFFNKKSAQLFKIDDNIKKLSVDKQFALFIKLILLFFLAKLLLIAVYFQRLPKRIPFFYSRPWGNEQLADKNYLWLFLVVLFVFSLFNLSFASKNRFNNPILTKLFIWITLILQLMGLISIIKMYTILSIW